MAAHFKTDKPKTLLAEFDARIAQANLKGKITTWEKSEDGKYYTHKAKEWHKLAWFKPVIGPSRLTFNIVKPKNRNVTTLVYAYYHGHLIETFLNHFEKQFSEAVAGALAETGDVVAA